MKFRSPTEEPIYLGLTSGHTFVIGAEPVEVPARFHRAAVMEGAIPEGMAALPPEEAADPTKMDLIVAAIKKMVADPAEGDFNNDGRPDVRKLSGKCGFTVLADERNAAWQIVSDDE